jgi:hypothetical protein
MKKPEIINGFRATYSLVFYKIRKQQFKVLIFLGKFIVNDIFHKCAKSQSKILSIKATLKWKNLRILGHLKSCTVHYFRYTILLILHCPEYRLSHTGFWHNDGINHCLHLEVLFIFFWSVKLLISNFQKNWAARSPSYILPLSWRNEQYTLHINAIILVLHKDAKH